jgi:signal transduction histidine kinase
MTEPPLVDWLSTLPVFEGVPAGQLQWFAEGLRRQTLPAGATLMNRDQPIDAAYLFYSGKVRLISAQDRITSVLEAGDIIGLLPYSRMKAPTNSGIAVTDTVVFSFPAARFREMIADHYELTEALVHHMLSRVRDFTSLQQQNEKMMALGKLSAGLAHELNNPAAAIARDAQSLQEHLRLLPESFKDVLNIRMTNEQVDAVSAMLFQSLQKERPVLTLLQRTDREEELTDWLEDAGVPDSGELAEAFTDFGFCSLDLEGFAAPVPPGSRKAVLKWIADNISTDKMVGDIGAAASRIETLVGSVKSFTHMDRGSEPQFADIRTGIRSTLTLLGYKLREGNVAVEEVYAEDLPAIKAQIGALNQVWTNLLDNAVDAMAGREGSTLRIETAQEGTFACVILTDNGPGIPEAIRTRIFDPFFTTKDVGKGTGLGLDVVQRIVAQHRGTIKVDSTPGHTAFKVCLPLNG